MEKKFEYGVFLGRFQPLHEAHLEIVRFALETVNRLIIAIGSSNQARSVKNPWTAEEREDMFFDTLKPEELSRIQFVHVADVCYNDNLWISEFQEKIAQFTEHSNSIALFGCSKDRSSFYLKKFPQWRFLEFPRRTENATDIRADYFRGNEIAWKVSVPDGVEQFLLDFRTNEVFKELCEEFIYIENYKKSWSHTPFPVIFNTVDAVVVKSGHVLVVRRKGHPGRNLVALPGGFLKPTERIQDGMLRELREETRIDVSKEELLTHIRDQHVFDAVDRSNRGRTISYAYLIDLKDGPLPRVKGNDDAAKAWWMPLRETHLRQADFFEDHYDIIRFMTSKF